LILPNLLVVGAQKAGTTSLYELLKTHPEFHLPVKEIKFFHRDEHYQKGINWYAQHFKDYTGQKYIGDFTPDYMAYSWSAERIYKQLGKDIKIIFILRHPVNRAYSQFNFFRMHGVESQYDFKKAIENEEIDLEQNKFTNWYTPANYISRSIYTPQIARFLNYFDQKNIHIVIFEELFLQKTKESIQELEHFLDLNLVQLISNPTKSNASQLPRYKNLKLFYIKIKRILNPLKIIFHFFGVTKILKSINRKVEKNLQKAPDKLSKKQINSITEKYFYRDILELEKIIGREIKIWK
tara:strand:- start:2205 stop:3089 length:885 start_codon:yes stop_codon:yes gene_type:complete